MAVDGKRVTRPATLEEAQKTVFKLVGQSSENQAWAEAGRKEGDRVTLTVRRRKEPRGWEEVEATGELRGKRVWTNANGRRLLGPLGPDQMADDGFGGSSWVGWYEGVLRTWAPLLDPWRPVPGSSRSELEAHEASGERVRALAKRYPGPFAAATEADWEAIRELLAGRPATLAKDSLEFRRLGEQRAEEVAAAGTKARAAFLQPHEKDLIPPFPAIDPVFGDRGEVEGKLTELPRVGTSEWVGQGDGTIFVFRDGQQQYFAAGESPAVEGALRARRRYEQKVTPKVSDRIAFVARITAEPALMVVAGAGLWGLMVEPVAASVGDDALFVDLTEAASDTPPPFAGEEELAGGEVALPPADAPPEDVLAAAFQAVKLGDQPLWRSLYAGWRVWFSDEGRPAVSLGAVYNHDSNWELARRQLLGEVADVRVRWVDDPVLLVTGDEFEGAPRIEQAEADVEHLRQEEKRSARSFAAVGLARRWVLQRFGDGPWRIVSNQAI